MDIAKLQTDEGLERKGVLVPYETGETKFLIAAHGNPRHKQRLAVLGQQYPGHRIRNKPELVDLIAIESMADAILLGWEGPVMLKGQPLDPNNREHRKKVLQIRPLREWIAEQAMNPAHFQDADAPEGDAEADDLKSGNQVDT